MTDDIQTNHDEPGAAQHFIYPRQPMPLPPGWHIGEALPDDGRRYRPHGVRNADGSIVIDVETTARIDAGTSTVILQKGRHRLNAETAKLIDVGSYLANVHPVPQ